MTESTHHIRLYANDHAQTTLHSRCSMLMQMDCHGITDVGRRRPNNQDHYLVADLNKSMRVHGTSLNLDREARIYGGSQGKLLLVADGMGGEAEGERASTIAVDQLTTYVLNSLSWCFRLEEGAEQDFEDHLKAALESCQQSIQAAVDERPEFKSMGTTMTMAYIVWPRAFIVHVGDSRCYLLHDGNLQQVTADHTMAALMAESGKLSADDARRSPMGHALWNVLGGKADELSVDVYKLTLEQDDTLLICTDGLYDMVDDSHLQQILETAVGAEEACRQLVELANNNGGSDNITAIVARVSALQLDEPTAMVQSEVPLSDLTALPSSDTTKTTPLIPS